MMDGHLRTTHLIQRLGIPHPLSSALITSKEIVGMILPVTCPTTPNRDHRKKANQQNPTIQTNL
jgi:hypothetical protein